MDSLTDISAVSARMSKLFDEFDRYVIDTEYDPVLDDLTREIAELRHALHAN